MFVAWKVNHKYSWYGQDGFDFMWESHMSEWLDLTNAVNVTKTTTVDKLIWHFNCTYSMATTQKIQSNNRSKLYTMAFLIRRPAASQSCQRQGKEATENVAWAALPPSWQRKPYKNLPAHDSSFLGNYLYNCFFPNMLPDGIACQFQQTDLFFSPQDKSIVWN